jgi:hypothetical protein
MEVGDDVSSFFVESRQCSVGSRAWMINNIITWDSTLAEIELAGEFWSHGVLEVA